jgi:protein involved in polysaccharide export with SLBB domain
LGYFEGATVRQLIEGAGGLGASADLKNAYVRRNDGSIEKVDLERLLVLRDFSADRPVVVGDSIVIPEKRRGVVVEGAVLHPGIVPFKPEFRATEYIDFAGGPAKDARGRSSYRLIGWDGHNKKLTDGSVIEPGDSILVPQRSFSRSEVVQLVLGGVGLLVTSATLVYLVVKP